MKYAKKMRLVDIDDDIAQPVYQPQPSDDNFTAPRILSTLDKSMHDILNRHDIDDGEKWALYNQILQRYLNHLKKTRQPVIAVDTNPQYEANGQRIHTPEAFNGNISNNISGIFPIGDSLEGISQPNVRNFFECARRSDVNQPQHSSAVSPISSAHQSPLRPLDISPEYIPQPLMSKRTTDRRAPKRGARHVMTNEIPHKVIAIPNNITPRRLFRNRAPAQSNYDFYWEATNAK